MTFKTLLPLLVLLVSLQAPAGPGHDHGDEAPVAAGVSLPRFALVSERFELVGVLDGQQLTLYLDRSASNEPLPEADIELTLAGTKRRPKPQADGSFVVALDRMPADGAHPVIAVVTLGDEVTQLAGSLALHSTSAHDDHLHLDWLPGAAVGVGLGVAAGVAFLRRKRLTAFGAAA